MAAFRSARSVSLKPAPRSFSSAPLRASMTCAFAAAFFALPASSATKLAFTARVAMWYLLCGGPRLAATRRGARNFALPFGSRLNGEPSLDVDQNSQLDFLQA